MNGCLSIILAILIVLFSVIFCNFFYNTRGFLFCLTMGLIISCLLFEVSSSILFSVDYFSIYKSELLSIMIIMALSGWQIILKKKIQFTCKIMTKELAFILLSIAIVIAVSKPTSGLCGIWRDDGSYQIKALELFSDHNDNTIKLMVKNNLPQDEKMWYIQEINKRLHSLWIRQNVETGAETGIMEEAFLERIYHNVPTLPAFLALFGRMFGFANMQYCQVLFLYLIIILFFYICEVNCICTPLEILGTLILVLSPQNIFFSHTAFTELYLILMVTLFCYAMIDYADSYWLISIAVLGFSLMHISIFAAMPVIIVCIWVNGITKKNTKIILQSIFSVLAYILGYTYMSIYNKGYVHENYYLLRKFLRGNFSYIQTTILVFSSSLLCVILAFIIKKRMENIYFFIKLLQRVVYALILVGGYITLKYAISYLVVEKEKATINFLYIIFSTGPLLFIAILSTCWRYIRNKNISDNDFSWMMIWILYTVIINCFCMPSVKYIYYFSRYNAVYMYVIVIAGSIALNSLDKIKYRNVLIYFSFFLLLSYIEPDIFLCKNYTDTIIKWDTFERIDNCISDNAAIVLDSDEKGYLSLLYMGFHAIGIDAYFKNNEWDIYKQCKDLEKAGYKNVYYLTYNAEKKLRVIDSINEIYQYTVLDEFKYHKKYKYPVSGYKKNKTLYVQVVK
ncbi:hypothetical protein [Butyrivibrio sp. M55]|uniref:hypothetical protein n=1 Tax=Butyrivibrio sp. M55 TaxID=1855323 RepID=UPI0008EDACBB|nr:hypothetical protein [Butyrivibrio sp. M55]SFU54581.1 hypothetical protein SAMN05216540_103264 [Butyrivibrio sp. M55]